MRNISLPGSIDEKNIEANFDNGVLSLRLPKTEEEKTKRIEVNAGSNKSKQRKLQSGEKTK